MLEQALGAVADLDRAVNGSDAASDVEAVCLRDQVERLIFRWRSLLGSAELAFSWDAGEAVVRVDPVRLRQALENLIANASEHGRLPIAVNASTLPGRVRVAVGDAGPARRLDPRRRRGRRGHGLAIAAEFAADHGGALRSWRGRDGGTVAAIDLPLAPPCSAPAPRHPPAAGRASPRAA